MKNKTKLNFEHWERLGELLVPIGRKLFRKNEVIGKSSVIYRSISSYGKFSPNGNGPDRTIFLMDTRSASPNFPKGIALYPAFVARMMFALKVGDSRRPDEISHQEDWQGAKYRMISTFDIYHKPFAYALRRKMKAKKIAFLFDDDESGDVAA